MRSSSGRSSPTPTARSQPPSTWRLEPACAPERRVRRIALLPTRRQGVQVAAGDGNRDRARRDRDQGLTPRRPVPRLHGRRGHRKAVTAVGTRSSRPPGTCSPPVRSTTTRAATTRGPGTSLQKREEIGCPPMGELVAASAGNQWPPMGRFHRRRHPVLTRSHCSNQLGLPTDTCDGRLPPCRPQHPLCHG